MSEVFEIRVAGDVPDCFRSQLADVEVGVTEVRTRFRADVRDQAELHGILAKLRAYGLEVVDIHRMSTMAEFEVTIVGDVGPVLRSAMRPAVIVSSHRATTIRVVSCRGLSHVLTSIICPTFRIEEVHLLS